MRVLVLMSTWNGKLYVVEQLDSILNQDFEGELKIIVRDDGSSDSTKDILKRYESRNVKVILGANIGVKMSYFALLTVAMSEEFDICALADQDDVWFPNRINQISSRINLSKPVFYCSALRLVDKGLNFISFYRHPGNRSLISSLFVNYVTGCTCAFNREFIRLVRLPNEPNRLIMHDWWLGCISAVYGATFYDEDPSVLYRQHGNNQVGIRTGLKRAVYIAKNIRRSKPNLIRLKQAQEMYKVYTGIMPVSELNVINEYIESHPRLTQRILFCLKYRYDIPILSAVRFVFDM